MRLNLILVCFLIGCCHNLIKERVEFTEKIISNPDEFQKILESSNFCCDNKKKYYNFNIIDNLKKFEYKYLIDKIKGWERVRKIEGKIRIMNKDTNHFIVYSGINNEYITFIFRLENGIWCFDSILNRNFFKSLLDDAL